MADRVSVADRQPRTVQRHLPLLGQGIPVIPPQAEVGEGPEPRPDHRREARTDRPRPQGHRRSSNKPRQRRACVGQMASLSSGFVERADVIFARARVLQTRLRAPLSPCGGKATRTGPSWTRPANPYRASRRGQGVTRRNSTAPAARRRPRSRGSGSDPLTRGSAQFAHAADAVEVDQTGAGAGAGARDLDDTLTDGLYVEA